MRGIKKRWVEDLLPVFYEFIDKYGMRIIGAGADCGISGQQQETDFSRNLSCRITSACRRKK